jgi:hypothetical protein
MPEFGHGGAAATFLTLAPQKAAMSGEFGAARLWFS